MARRFVVTDPLDARARLVFADEKTAKPRRHAADRLGRGLAARLAWHHGGEPRGSQSPHPAPCRDPGGGQVSQRRADGRAGRSHAVADAALSRQEGANFLDHRWRRSQAAALARCTPIGSEACATRCLPPAPSSSSSRSAAITRSGQVSPARAKTPHNGRPICGYRNSRSEVLPIMRRRLFVERSGQKKSTCVASKVGSILAEPMVRIRLPPAENSANLQSRFRRPARERAGLPEFPGSAMAIVSLLTSAAKPPLVTWSAGRAKRCPDRMLPLSAASARKVSLGFSDAADGLVKAEFPL